MVMQPPEDGAMNVRGQETHNQSRSYSIKARRRLTKLEGEKKCTSGNRRSLQPILGRAGNMWVD